MQFKATGEVKINIAVLAYSNKILWDCRNFLYAFMDKTKCNLGITLTKNVDVIFRGMKFMPGGFDLVVVADVFCEQKYDEFVNTITTDPNHTRVFFFGEEHKNVKSMGSMITVSSKEQLEKQLRKEITGLLFGEPDITYKGT